MWTVPGNHENFGIERDTSHVELSHPLYGRGMYHHFRGPDYYSFTFGGVHFVGLNTVDIDDKWYYGHVDSTQLAWLEKDLARIPASMPVVTFDHIPFFSAAESINGYMAGPPAPSIITVNGVTTFRHTVGNAKEVSVEIPRPPPRARTGRSRTHSRAPALRDRRRADAVRAERGDRRPEWRRHASVQERICRLPRARRRDRRRDIRSAGADSQIKRGEPALR